MTWWRKLFSQDTPEPLRAAPAVRRQKSYSAASGYVYEYFYEGFRQGDGCRRHVFTVSADRKDWFELHVIVEDTAIESWAERHGRQLAENERYAVAKMALFEAFDERPDPVTMRHPVLVDANHAERLLLKLGI